MFYALEQYGGRKGSGKKNHDVKFSQWLFFRKMKVRKINN